MIKYFLWGKCGQLSLRIKWHFMPNVEILSVNFLIKLDPM
jgi:hypothetical protein